MGASASRIIRALGGTVTRCSPSAAADVSGPQDVSAEHAREHSRSLPRPSRTFELGRVALAANRLILLKPKLGTKLAQFPAWGESGQREREDGPRAAGAIHSSAFVSAIQKPPLAGRRESDGGRSK